MVKTMKESSGEWLEPLLYKCPPDTAIEPNNFCCYRLMSSSNPNESDFYSHRKLFPNREYNATECRVRSLSVYDNLIGLEEVRKLPAQKSKVPVKLILSPQSGVIKQTGNQSSHYSLWLKVNFRDHIKIESA